MNSSVRFGPLRRFLVVAPLALLWLLSPSRTQANEHAAAGRETDALSADLHAKGLFKENAVILPASRLTAFVGISFNNKPPRELLSAVVEELRAGLIRLDATAR